MKNLSQEGVLSFALISYSVKLMISGATFADAACLAALGTLSSIFYYIKHNKAKIVERDQLEEVTKLRNEVALEVAKFKDDVVQEVSKIKMTNNLMKQMQR
jgi:hypothetical protein